MLSELLPYYEKELTYIRHMAKDFAKKYPKIANRLLLENERSQDPHVERLLQGFALLAARIHRKLDDGYPQVTESLLSVLYPHYLAPVPSMTIVQFQADPDQGMLTSGYTIDRHSQLYSKPINGTPCQFRTAYPTTLWPIEVAGVSKHEPSRQTRWPSHAQSALKINLKSLGGSNFSELSLKNLRFYLGSDTHLAYDLYEMLFNNTVRVEFSNGAENDAREKVILNKQCLQPVGFREDEGLLDYPRHSFPGYRLIQEYFTFPEKFLFLDCRLPQWPATFGESPHCELIFYFDRPLPRDGNIGEAQFQLNCVPAVNLFKKIAEPVNVDHTKSEYQLIADLRRQPAMEIYSIDRVTSSAPYLDTPREYPPFYAYRHTFDDAGLSSPVFWHAVRKPVTVANLSGSDVFLSLVNLDFQTAEITEETLTVETTCTNRDLPILLPFQDPQGDFELEGATPVTRIQCVSKPTPTRRPALGSAAQWKLISHLSLNYLSLTDGEDGKHALQEILKLYDFTDSAITQQQITGIAGIHSKPVVHRVMTENGAAIARGLGVDLILDEEMFVGSGMYLFASVLNRFLSLYVSINSFCQLAVTSKQRNAQKKGPLKIWSPRIGEKILL